MASNVLDTLKVVRGSHRYNAWLYNRIKDHLNGRVLDVGSGLGDIARQFVNPAIEEVILTDYAQEMVDALKQAPLPLKKYQIKSLDIASPKVLLDHPREIADTITCVNVLEHIEDDIAALKHMRHLLCPGGQVVILVPALPVIYGSLDVHVEHCRRYTKKSLRKALESTGFLVKDEYYMNMFGIVSWYVAGRVLKQKRFHHNACRILDQMVPILRAMEFFGSPPLGQSLIMVGQAV